MPADNEKPLAPGEVPRHPTAAMWVGAGVAALLVLVGISFLHGGAPPKPDAPPPPAVAHSPDFVPLEGRFTIRDEAGRSGVDAQGRWRIANGQLEVVADETRIWDRRDAFGCPHCEPLLKWRYVLRSNSYAAYLAPAGRVGFDPQFAREEGEVKVASHRMVVPLQQYKDVYEDPKTRVAFPAPPGVLAEFWIGIDLYYDLHSPVELNMQEPYAFADALAARDLGPSRCARIRGVAEAVERGCHDRLARYLATPLGRNEIDQGGGLAIRRSRLGTRPLQVAIHHDDLKAATLLLDHGAVISGQDARGYSMLIQAAVEASPEFVTLLLKHGARIDEQVPPVFRASAGRTALMQAAETGRVEVVRVLLAAGANTRVAAEDGRTALRIASDANKADVVALLR